MTQRIKMMCDSCGGFDYCDMSGRYVERHECHNLNTNQLLLRIAFALEQIQQKMA